MVKVATLEVEVGAKIDQFEKSLKKVSRDISGMDKRLGGVTRGANKASAAFSGMARRLIAVGAAYFGARGIFKMGKSFLNVATSVETYRLRLEAMLGSQQKATEAMNFFKEVAAKVPFTLEEVIEAGVKVQAFGADLKKWTPIMADLAAFMGVKLPEAASALGRAFAGGAGAADVFRERGILQVIKDFARMEKGIGDITKISLPEFRDVMFEAFAGAESKVAGTADKLATTWVGLVSMLQDKWFKFRDAVMKAGVFELLKSGLKAFNEKLDDLVKAGKLDTWAADTAISVLNSFQAILKGIEGIMLAWGGFKTLAFTIASFVGSIMKAQIGIMTAPLKLLEKIPGKLGDPARKMLEEVNKLTGTLTIVTDGYNEAADKQGEELANIIENFDKLREGLQKVRSEIEKTKDAEKKLAEVTKELDEKVKKFGETIGNTALPAAKDLSTIFDITVKLSEKGKLMFENMVFAFSGGITEALDAFHRLGEEGGSVLRTLGEVIHGFVGQALNALKRFTTELIVESAKVTFAKEAEAIAGVIASVMASVGFPLNLVLVGGAIAAVSALFSGLKPKKFQAGGDVPVDTFAQLHAGEKVLSAAEVRRGAGGGGVTINVSPVINIAAMDSMGVRDFMRNKGLPQIIEAVKAGVLKPELREALGVKT